MLHQYIARDSSNVKTEALIADRWIALLYSSVRENSRFLFNLLTSPRFSEFIAHLNFDTPCTSTSYMVKRLGIDMSECLEFPDSLKHPRQVFERKIRYWECRPMLSEDGDVLSPADSRMLAGSFRHSSRLFVKEKFFEFDALPGLDKTAWRAAFRNGDYAVFRLTPEKYHYTHTPVSGRVLDFYSVDGACHSCNPTAVVKMVTPYSKNKRVVTIIDTDVPGGSGVGLVGMIEVVALMIGDIIQCYSENYYDRPAGIVPGMFLEKGRPKGLFRPGSSVVILLFQEHRIAFCDDILRNLGRTSAESRFSEGFGKPLVETEVTVRSKIAQKRTTS